LNWPAFIVPRSQASSTFTTRSH